MSWFVGIDIGSAYSKGVICRDSDLAAWHVLPSGSDYRRSAEAVMAELVRRVDLSRNDIASAAATGAGAESVDFACQKASDIVCTARGIHAIFPQARTIIDIASLSTRSMRVSEEGRVTNFTVSDKCAAGGGRLIEVIANVLRVELDDFGPLSSRSANPITLATGCAVFGESEAITRVSEGIPKEDIAAGVNKALARNISSLVRKLGMEEPCAICGGGALNASLVKTVEVELGVTLLIPANPQVIAAYGAAMIARAAMLTESVKKPGC
jgi:(R)-2-hydroxyacyl-CoA dehydratese activating ATPase